MLFWTTEITYKEKGINDPGVARLFIPEDSVTPKQDLANLMRSLNDMMETEEDSENKMYIYMVKGRNGYLAAALALPITDNSLEDCLVHIKKVLEKNYDVCNIEFSNKKEITGTLFSIIVEKADDQGYVSAWYRDKQNMRLDYMNCSFRSDSYNLSEYLENKEFSTQDDAKTAAIDIMADPTLTEELERIYSDENEKKYYGNPVHYHISASTPKSAIDIINVIIPALLANKRLLGKRILHISEIHENCHGNPLIDAFESAQGNAIIIEMSGTNEEHGNYASAYNRVLEHIDKLICKYHLNTLCFFVEIKERSGFSDALLSRVSDTIHLIHLNEGFGNRAQAESYLRRLAQKDDFVISEDNMAQVLRDKELFTVADVYEMYNKLFKSGLRGSVYKAYRDYDFNLSVRKATNSVPYEELQKMVGLSEIKAMVDQIIDAGKIRKMRSHMGLNTHKPSLHMVFTGNPGSAKTTVARLIAQILRKEGILDGGKLVECGRADLIGKYVGWTAKQVCAKFREAKGGILFIDEAYSLVDDSHSFADEAINTIVSEMENNREDIIVIFAGYPDKMKDFLNKNEGLRSRIAFHLDFPDYKPSEMMEILKLMADERGYKIDEKARDKCMGIFEAACNAPDFGNGRFVRNLLDQAEMAQSHRIALGSRSGKITKTLLCTLKAEDFDINISKQTGPTKQPMGFAI